MLKGTLAFVLVLILGLAGAELKGRLVSGRHRFFSFGGLEAVLIGTLLGQAGLGLLPHGSMSALRPVVLLGLTWMGLLIGLQFDLRLIRSMQPWQRWLGFLIPAGAGCFSGVVALAAGLQLRAVVLLAAMAMIGSPRLITLFLRGGPPADRSAMRLIRLVTTLASTPAIIVYGVGTTAAVHSTLAGGGAMTCVAAVGLAVVLGYATIMLLRREHEDIHVLALLVGIVALLAGAATMIAVEPMALAAVTGGIIANRGHLAHRALRAARAIETPMVTAVLVLLGAWWVPRAPILAVCGVLVVIRGAALLAGGTVLRGAALRHGVRLRTRILGVGLLPQGPLTLALLVGGAVTGRASAAFAAGVFVALFINHVIAEVWMRRVLFIRATPDGGASP